MSFEPAERVMLPEGWKAYPGAKKLHGRIVTYIVDLRAPDGTRHSRPELKTTDPVLAGVKFVTWLREEFPAVRADWEESKTDDPALGPNPKLSIVFDYYTKKYLPIKDASASTIAHYEQVLREFELHCRGERVGRAHQLSRSIVDGYASKLVRDGQAAKTVHNKLATIRSCLNAAIDAGLLESSPIKKWLMPKFGDPDIQPLTPEELNRVLAMVQKHEPDVYNIVRWMAFTGMRAGDAREMEWPQLDLKHRKRTRRVRKTKKRNTLTFSKEALKAVLDEKARGKSSAVVFTNPDGEPFSRNYVLRAWTRALRKGKFRHCRLHDLRHTFAYILINIVKCPLPIAMEALEHENIKTTMKYCQTGPVDEHLECFDTIVVRTTEQNAKSKPPRATKQKAAGQ